MTAAGAIIARRLTDGKWPTAVRFGVRSWGDVTRMPLLLVDDRDGRILAELQTEDQVRRVLEALASDDVTVPEYLCLVECRTKHGSLLGTDTSIKFRPLS